MEGEENKEVVSIILFSLALFIYISENYFR